jgi:hypothetical protein
MCKLLVISMECQIDQLALPVISEQGHQMGDCYCYLCTCGEHRCPSNTVQKKIVPSNAFGTVYSMAFTGKRTLVESPMKREGEILRSKQKMVLETTQRKEFRAVEQEYYKSPTLKREESHSPFHFYTSSTYQADFPNWKFYGTADNRLKERYSQSPTKFTGVSTYGHDFTKFEVPGVVRRSRRQNNSLIGYKEWETGKTVNQISYRPHKLEKLPKRSEEKELEGVKIISGSVKTTYQKNFLPYISPSKVPTKRQLTKVSDAS